MNRHAQHQRIRTFETVIIADAKKVTPAQFMDAVFGPSNIEEMRAKDRERCIRAIERGDVYGIPPVLVRECLHIMAMRAAVKL